MRHAKMPNIATMPNGMVASIDPFWLGDALQKPEPFSPLVCGVASLLAPGTNCVGSRLLLPFSSLRQQHLSVAAFWWAQVILSSRAVGRVSRLWVTRIPSA